MWLTLYTSKISLTSLEMKLSWTSHEYENAFMFRSSYIYLCVKMLTKCTPLYSTRNSERGELPTDRQLAQVSLRYSRDFRTEGVKTSLLRVARKRLDTCSSNKAVNVELWNLQAVYNDLDFVIMSKSRSL